MSSYQFGSPDPLGAAGATAPVQTAKQAGEANSAGIRVNVGGASRITYNDGNVQTEDLGARSYDASKEPNGEQGLMSTLNRGGRPIAAADAKPTDFVKIGGMDVTVRVAERLGFFSRTDAGRLSNVSDDRMREVTGAAQAERQQAATEAQKAAQAQQEAANKLPDAAAEAAFGTIQSATPGTVTRALSQIAETGNLESGLLGTLATEAGVHPSVMGQHLSNAMNGFTQQAKAFVEKQGVSGDLYETFGDWARRNHPTESTEAIVKHVSGRDPSAYGKLVGKFVENLADVAPEVLLSRVTLADGTKPYKGSGGNIMVRVGSTEMPWRAAIRGGLVKLAR